MCCGTCRNQTRMRTSRTAQHSNSSNQTSCRQPAALRALQGGARQVPREAASRRSSGVRPLRGRSPCTRRAGPPGATGQTPGRRSAYSCCRCPRMVARDVIGQVHASLGACGRPLQLGKFASHNLLHPVRVCGQLAGRGVKHSVQCRLWFTVCKEHFVSCLRFGAEQVLQPVLCSLHAFLAMFVVDVPYAF
jgi:hypothetical protein